MQRAYAILLALTGTLAPIGLLAQSPAPTLADQYNQLALATHLDRKGAPPFHLKVETQLYKLDGGKSQKGTIEEWWMSPDEYRIEINSGSLHEVHATGEPEQPSTPTRDSYLLNELYDAIVHPLPHSFPGKGVTETRQKFGKDELACFQPQPPGGFISAAKAQTACTEPGTNNLRVYMRDPQVTVRNKVGLFVASNVAVSNTISYFGRPAITGTIATLESLSPSSPGASVLKTNPPRASSGVAIVTHLASGVAAGRLITRTSLHYPEDALRRHVTGIVLLHAIITKQGTLGGLFVIASPDQSLSDAALDCVREWRYQPYLLNGQPVEVDTHIQLNFNIGGR